AHVLADSQAALLFVDSTGAPMAGRLAPMRTLTVEPVNGVEDYVAWRDARPDTDLRPALDPGEPCIQLYTSGTTGRPKGVQLSHRAFFVFNAYAAAHPEEF